MTNTTPAPDGTRVKPRRRWRRRLLWCVAIAFGGRLVLALAMPWLVDFGAGMIGCTASYRSATLSLLGLSLHLEDLEVRDATDSTARPLLVAQELTADLSTWQLLHGEIVVVDAAVSACTVDLVRNADGSLRLPAAMLPKASATQEPAAPPTPPANDLAATDAAATQELPSFALPLTIASARLHDLKIRCHDESFTPARDFEAIVDVDVADVGRPEGPGHLTIRAQSPGLLDQLHLQASATTTRDHLELQWQLTVRGVHLTELPLPADALTPIAPARDANLDFGGSLAADRAPDRGSLASLTGEVHSTLQLDAIERLRMRASIGPLQRTGEHFAAPLTAELYCPDLIDQLYLQQGQVRLAPGQADVSATLKGKGLTLRRLQPMLKELGITIEDGGVDLSAQLTATLPMQPTVPFAARLQNVAVRHGDERLELAQIDLGGVQLDGSSATIGSVEITGPSVRLAREPDGTIAVAGIRVHPQPPSTASHATQPSAVPGQNAATCPVVRVKHIDWHDGSVHFTDSTLPGSPSLELADLRISAEELAFGIDQPPGHASVTLRLPDNVESLRADLHVQPNANGAAGDLTIDATGITAKGLAPWLRGAGIEPMLQSGSLGVAISGQVQVADGAIEASGRIANLRLEDAGVVLMSLRNVELEGLRSDAAGLDLGTLRVDEPHLVVEQWPEGRMRMAGMQFGPTTTSANTPPASQPTEPKTATASAPGRLRAGTMTLQGAQFTFRDLRAEPRELQLGIDAELGRQNGDGTPTTFRANLRMDQAIESLALSGELQPTPDGIRLQANVDGKGLHGDGLAIVLPANIRSTLSDGSLLAQLSLTTHTRENTTALDLLAEQIALRDRNEELLAIDRLELHAPSLGPALIHIATLQVHGVRAIAAQTSDGLAVPGLLIQPAPPRATGETPATDLAAVAAANRPAAAEVAPRAMPALRIDQLDVGLDLLRFRDRVLGEATPLELGVHIKLEEPWATTQDLAETPAAVLSCTVTAAPLCREMRVEAHLQPFLLTPTLDLNVHALGIDPTAITRVLPTLGERLGGTTSNATLTAHVHAFLDLRRRNPARFDFSRPFGAQILIENVELRDAITDTSLAAIPSIDVLARSIDPATGNVRLKTVDIENPILRATRTKDGLECAGFVFREAPSAIAEPATPPPIASTTSQPPPEFSIDRLRVQGLSFEFRDSVTTPVTYLPVQDLDLDLQHFSTQAFREPQSFTFQLTMRGGEVELPRRILRSSVVAGLLGSAATALSGGSDQHELEQRPLFQELLLTGQMQVYPQARGTCRFDLSGFEMTAIRGLANLGGVVINDGIVDANITSTSLGPQGTKVKSGITFTWLSMSEPPNGPVSTYLRLPAPLDSVLWVLRNDAEEQRIPMQIEMPANGVSAAAIRNAAVESLTLLIGKAIGSAPMRAAGAVTGLLGLGGARDDLKELVTTLPSQAGEVEPDLSSLTRLLAATANDLEVKFVLSHELGAADLERAAALANPAPEIQKATIARLRDRRAELSASRSQLAVEAAALYAAGNHDAEAARSRLSTMDTELGGVEATLDQALAMLDGNTRHDRARNTRRAALALGNLRLEAVRAAIEARLPPGSADRIELRPARGVATAGLVAGGQVVVTPRPRPAPDTARLQRDGTERVFERQERQGLYVPPGGLRSMDAVQLPSPRPPR
jgi:hypothetical protein